MASTSFSPGDHFTRFINEQVQAGHYKNASDVMRAALRMLEEHEERRQALRLALQEGLDSGVGEPFSMNAFLKRMRETRGTAE